MMARKCPAGGGQYRPEDAHAISVVGSRNVTHYGSETAKKLSYQLAFAGYTIVSGLARGIDTAAHQGSLAAKAVPEQVGFRFV